MLRLKDLTLIESCEELGNIPNGKVLINTINAHSYNTAQKDDLFAKALRNGDYLIPDGASIVKACRWLNAKSRPKERIAGWDLFEWEMNKVSEEPEVSEERKVKSEESKPLISSDESIGLSDSSFFVLHSSLTSGSSFFTLPSSLKKKKVMFMGSSERVLSLIRRRMGEVYPQWDVVTYSPPYKPEFSEEDNKAIIDAINAADPDLLWIGMTAPKQEKWTYANWDRLNIHCHVGTIGAVFDFFAGTARRAPLWWQKHSLEWLYRLLIEPKRMWRRYLIGNALFLWNIFKEKYLPY